MILAVAVLVELENMSYEELEDLLNEMQDASQLIQETLRVKLKEEQDMQQIEKYMRRNLDPKPTKPIPHNK